MAYNKNVQSRYRANKHQVSARFDTVHDLQLYDAFKKYIDANNISANAYVKYLIAKDLISKGLWSDKVSINFHEKGD